MITPYAKLRNFYLQHNPNKLRERGFLRRVLQSYRGRKEELWANLHLKYVILPKIAGRRIARWIEERVQERKNNITTFYEKYNPKKLLDEDFIRNVSRRYGLTHRSLLWQRLHRKYKLEPKAAKRIQRAWRSRLLYCTLKNKYNGYPKIPYVDLV